MAKQTSLITFTNKLGNMIGYCRNGKHFLRSMPETVRQTASTRRAAQRFGMASKKGAIIRSAFSEELDVRCDGSHINRLNKTIIMAGRNNTAAITGFRFNQDAGIDRFFSVMPKFSRDGILSIPPQVMPQFKGIAALEVKVIAVRISFAKRCVTGSNTSAIILDPGEYFAGTTLSVDAPGEGTLLITLQVRGMHDDEPSRNRKYLAADIIAVLEPKPQQIFHKPTYPRQAVLNRQSEALLNNSYIPLFHPAIQRE